MKISDLRVTHPSYDAMWFDRVRDLFEGGQRMRKNAQRHLIRNDKEPEDVFRRRCNSSHYVNYCAPLGAFFAAFVGSSPVRLEGGDSGYWAEFEGDCDGRRADFNTFLTKRITEAMQTRIAWWRVVFPAPVVQPEVLADLREQELDRAALVPLCAEQIIDWERDDYGRFLWVREYDCRQRRLGAGKPPVTVETWTEWHADGTAQRWQVAYEGDKAPSDSEMAPEVPPPYNPISRMPLVALELPESLYLMGHMESPQTESFRKRAALSWAIDRTCYAMPVMFLEDDRSPSQMGAGYYLKLGIKERMEWPAPPSAPFAVIDDYNVKLVQEMHRVASAMARGVDNNQAAAIGRSGESKQQDNEATEIIVAEFGRLMREAAQETIDIVAEGASRGEAPTVAGYDNYTSMDSVVTIEQFIALDTVELHSVTAKREIEKRAIRAFMPDLDPDKFADIDREVDENLTPEELDPQEPAGEPTMPEGTPAQT